MMEEHAQTTTEQTRTSGHEPNRFSMPFIVSAGIAIAMLIAAALILMSAMFASLGGQRSGELALPDSVTLDPSQRQELQTMLDAEQAILQSYAWIDEQAGIARIPIDRAMDLLLDGGLPTRDEGDSTDAEEAN